MLLCSGTPWTPNKCLGFRTVAQTAYIFAMRPNQQHRNDKRKYDKNKAAKIQNPSCLFYFQVFYL